MPLLDRSRDFGRRIRRPRPGRAVRRLRDLGGRAGADALPGAGGGADRARQRRQRHPVHADRHREEPGRHRRPLRGAGARGADVLHGADQGAGLGEVLRADRRLRRGERRHADRRRGGQRPGADRLLHRRGAGQHRAARGRRGRRRPGGDGRVPLLRRARPWLGVAGAAARAAAGAVPADVRDARRRHPVRGRPDPAYGTGDGGGHQRDPAGAAQLRVGGDPDARDASRSCSPPTRRRSTSCTSPRPPRSSARRR